MSIYESAVKKPVTTILIFIGIMVFGIFSLTRLNIDLMPKIETSNVMIFTGYTGASAEDIENNVTKPLENALNGISNLKHITSKSQDNLSFITLEFNAGTDIAEATNDIRDKLDAFSSVLPDGVGKPMIFKFGTGDIPVVILAAEATESAPALRKILENNVSNRIERIEGVGTVMVAGTIEREIHIYCDPYRLQSYNLTLSQISQAIGAENRNISTGQLDLGNSTNSLRIKGEFSNPEELEEIVVANYKGKNVYLRDVARIEDSEPEYVQRISTNGNKSSIILVRKQSDANAVKISNQIRKILPEIAATLPADVKLSYALDTSDFIVGTINSLFKTIIITFVVVMLVVLFFLGRWRATFIIVLTIPISLIGSFIYLMGTGNTLNIVSLSSLSIAIGMVVDDAIVVLENISKHMERGSHPKQAAIHATNEVGISVIASTLTMLAVFLPLTMIGGFTGILFNQLGWIVSIVMVVSTVSALSLTPVLCSQMLRRKPKQIQFHDTVFGRIERGLDKLDNVYTKLLSKAVYHRTATVLITIVIFVLTLMLAPLMKTEFLPESDTSNLQANVELPIGTSAKESARIGNEIYNRWKKEIPELDVCTMSTGQADEDNATSAINENGSNIIIYFVNLKKASQRTRKSAVIAEQIRQIIADFPEVVSYKVQENQGGGSNKSAVEIDIFGYDFEKTDAVARNVAELVRKSKACAEANISRKDYKPEFRIVFDRKKLADQGMNISMAASYVHGGIQGTVSTYFREDGEEYKVRVHLDPKYRSDLNGIRNIVLVSPGGTQLRLGDVAKIEEESTPPTIERKDRQRVVTIRLTQAPKAALSQLVKASKQAIKEVELPEGISYDIGGTYEDQQNSFRDLFTLMGLITMLVFIVMAAQFESLLDPFVIMFSIPFAVSGVIIGLFITQIPFSVMGLIGLIMLVGIVVKNGIVLIDYTRLCRERGMGILESVISAGRSRLRPVLMTTLTTVLGMVPLAIGIGEGSEMWQPMGVTVAFGLTVSTLITLVLIPTIYVIFSGIEQKRQWRRYRRRRMIKINRVTVWKN